MLPLVGCLTTLSPWQCTEHLHNAPLSAAHRKLSTCNCFLSRVTLPTRLSCDRDNWLDVAHSYPVILLCKVLSKARERLPRCCVAQRLPARRQQHELGSLPMILKAANQCYPDVSKLCCIGTFFLPTVAAGYFPTQTYFIHF